MFAAILPRPGPKIYGFSAAHWPRTAWPVSEAFLFLFPYVVYCAMMFNADDMNHVLLLFLSKTNICLIGLPTPLECNVRNYIRPG